MPKLKIAAVKTVMPEIKITSKKTDEPFSANFTPKLFLKKKKSISIVSINLCVNLLHCPLHPLLFVFQC